MSIIKTPFSYIIIALGLMLYASCHSNPPDLTSEAGNKTIAPTNPDTLNVSMNFKVSNAIYDKTFQDVNKLIEELNHVIRTKNYEKWLAYLTVRYIEETSKPEYLAKWRDDRLLKKANITIGNLKDYFFYLVVPRRDSARLDLLEFQDAAHLYAYTLINNEKYLLYYLIKTDNGWKIDFY